MANKVAVMYMGKIVESGDARTIFSPPAPSLHAGADAVRAQDGAQRQATAGAHSPAACPTRSPFQRLRLFPALSARKRRQPAKALTMCR